MSRRARKCSVGSRVIEGDRPIWEKIFYFGVNYFLRSSTVVAVTRRVNSSEDKISLILREIRDGHSLQKNVSLKTQREV